MHSLWAVMYEKLAADNGLFGKRRSGVVKIIGLL